MNFKETIKFIYQKKWFIFWVTVLGAVLFFDLMVIQEPQYKSNSKILVVQKQVYGQDIYTISKSAQYITNILKEGIYSDVFFENILLSPYGIEANDFSEYFKKRRKEWKKSVKVLILRDTGVMEINVFYPQKEKAEQINSAIINILEKDHQFYHGENENIEVKILNKPIVSQNPISINLWLGTIFGGLFGFLIGISWILRKNKKETSFLDKN